MSPAVRSWRFEAGFRVVTVARWYFPATRPTSHRRSTSWSRRCRKIARLSSTIRGSASRISCSRNGRRATAIRFAPRSSSRRDVGVGRRTLAQPNGHIELSKFEAQRNPDIEDNTVADETRSEFLSTLARELRHAARVLLRTPAFSLIVFITLALGIGATTAIYTVLDAVVLRPLAYRHADR